MRFLQIIHYILMIVKFWLHQVIVFLKRNEVLFLSSDNVDDPEYLFGRFDEYLDSGLIDSEMGLGIE